MGKTRQIKLAILGFGNAGRAFAGLLSDKKSELLDRYGISVEVVAITTGSRGSLINPLGINLDEARLMLETTGRFDPDASSSMDVCRNVDYDILIELTPLQIFSGQPAIDHIKAALNRGKHVITANKGPIAWAYEELKALAAKNKALFFFETTVMDGTPIFNLVNDTLKFCKITEVSGILNSTTNYVLEELAKGREYGAVIAEGKERGFIEADPAMDIEGYDAAAKTTALLNVLMGADITPDQVDRTGIDGISLSDIEAAALRGNTIKLICKGTLENGKVKASVKPTEINKASLLANIDGTSSVVSITTDLMGTISIVEHLPEIEQTAYGIFSDLVRVLERLETI